MSQAQTQTETDDDSPDDIDTVIETIETFENYDNHVKNDGAVQVWFSGTNVALYPTEIRKIREHGWDTKWLGFDHLERNRVKVCFTPE